MNSVTLGDMAQFYSLRRYNSEANTELSNLVTELGTGEVADMSAHLSGDFTGISAIERSLDMNRSFETVLDSATVFVNGQSIALADARKYTASTGISLLDAAGSGEQTRKDAVLAESKTTFDAIVSTLNVQAGGKSLFSGAATQSAAFASANDILTAFAASLTGASTAGDVMAVADSWFGASGTYETAAYLGSLDPLDGFKVGASETIQPTISGNDSEIRDLLKLHAIAAVVADGQVSMIEQERENLMSLVGSDMINLDNELIFAESGIGAIQERISIVQAENNSEMYGLLSNRYDLVGVDPSDTAMRLSETETRLEALYAVTARLSGLSLVGYL